MSDAEWVLIPMEVSALAVGTGAGKYAWSDPTPDFSQIYNNQILTGRDLIKQRLFQDSTPPDGGVHLHWFLPEAYGHGVRKEGGPLAFPRVPNRWLIRRARHAENAFDVTQVIDWLLESDYRWKTDEFGSAKDKTGVPQSPKDKTSVLALDRDGLFANVGKLTLLGQGRTIDAPNDDGFDLTALGSVGPEFAACYPACKSVFGFHDSDPADGGADPVIVTDLVVGWYSDSTKDLLSGSNAEHWESKLAELGWTLSRTWCPWPWPQVRSMCHGAVTRITWSSGFTHQSQAPTSDAKVYIGATPAEALATLLAREMKPESGDSVELLLAAFQYGMLADAEHLGDVQADFHRRRFTTSPGGERYSVKPKPRPVQQNAGPPPRDLEQTSVSATLPPEIDDLLVRLNGRASALARARRELASLRQARFTTWASWARDYVANRQAYKDAPPRPPDLDPSRASEPEVAAKAKEAAAAGAECETARKMLENALAARFPDLELSCSAEPPFFRAADPAILIESAGLKASGIFDRRDGSETLPCRWVKEIVSGISATVVQEAKTALARDLIRLPSPTWSLSSGPSPDLLDALLRELMLVSPPEAPRDRPWIASVSLSLSGGILDGDEQANLESEISGLVATRPPAAAGSFKLKFISDGSDVDPQPPHPVAIARWSRNSWRPLFLAWKVKWLPDDQLKGAGDIPGKWSPWPLDETGNEFKTSGTVPAAPDVNQGGFQAYTLLGPRPELVLRRRLQTLGQRSQVGGEGAWNKVISKIDSLEILAQSLAGFHDALRQLSLGLQLPLINPACISDTTGPVRDAAADPYQGIPTIDPQRMQAPDTSFEFQPIRAGRLEVARLWIVDSFGQTWKIIDADAEADCPLFPSFGLPGPSTIPPGPTASSKRYLIPLPPRYVQPARFDFRWVSGPGDAPGGSPVRGWIFPNHLDKSLMICGANGRLLGMLRRPIGASATASATFFWIPVPGTETAVKDIPDDDLRAFANYLLGLDSDTADAFATAIRTAQNDAPGAVEHDLRLAILVGKPLALARASLRIELDSMPVSRAPEADAGGAAPSNPTRGFARVKFPVRMGGPEGDAGGLAGFFVGEPGEVFYPRYGLEGRSDLKKIEHFHELLLDAETAAPLTLLLDPAAPIHIRSGVLPLHTFQLPEAAAAAVSSIRDVFFQAAPLLGSLEESPKMPRPSDDYGRWSWAVRPNVTMWQEYADIADPGNRAMFGQQPLALREGWLKLVMNPVSVTGFWVKEGATKVAPGSRITLGWMVEGAESLTLTASVVVNGAATKQELRAWSKDQAPGLPDTYQVQIGEDWRGISDPTRSPKDAEAGSEIISLSLIASGRSGARAMKSIQLTLTRS
jgi:hypothetical protein